MLVREGHKDRPLFPTISILPRFTEYLQIPHIIMNIIITTRKQYPISDYELYSLIQDSYQQWVDEGIQARWLKQPFADFCKMLKHAVVFLAVNTPKRQLLGLHCFYCYPKKHYAYGFYLAVNSQAKYQGIATQMLKYEKEQFLARGYRSLIGVTEVTATWSVRWHLKNGYRIFGYSKGRSPYCDTYSFRLQLSPVSWYQPSTWLWNKPMAPITARCCYLVSYAVSKMTHQHNGQLNWMGKLAKRLVSK